MSFRKAFGHLALIIATLSGFVFSPRGDPSLNLAQQAELHLARKEYGAAEAKFKEALTLNPARPKARDGLANFYRQKRRFDEAGAVLQSWSRLAPDDPQPHLSLGALLEAQGRLDEAAAELRLSLDLEPEQPQARLQLAEVYLRQQHFERARAELEALLDRDEENQPAHFRLGQLLVFDDGGAAKAHLRLAAEAKSDAQTAGKASRLLDRVREAEKEANRAYASALLGLAFLETRDVALAQRQFAEATRLDPAYGDAQAYLGYTLLLLQQPSQAEEPLKMAISIGPSSSFAHHLLGSVLRAQGSYDEALVEMRKAADLDPADPVLLSDLAGSYLAAGNLSDAEEYYLKAAAAAKDDPVFSGQLAHFYLDRLFKVADGLDAARRLAELRPDDGGSLDLLGWALYLNGQPEEAEKTLARALALDPDLASVHYHLAVLWDKSSRRAEATRAYERAAELDLNGTIAKRALTALIALTGSPRLPE